MNARKVKNEDSKSKLNKQLRYQQYNVEPTSRNARSFHTFMYEMGRFLVDIAKLVFAGVILAGIMDEGIDRKMLFILGGIVVLTCVFLGIFIISKNKEGR